MVSGNATYLHPALPRHGRLMPRHGLNGRCQRAQAIKRRRQIREALGFEESGASCATLEKSLGGRGNIAFAAETAAITGESKSQINRHLARADALGDDLERITGTSITPARVEGTTVSRPATLPVLMAAQALCPLAALLAPTLARAAWGGCTGTTKGGSREDLTVFLTVCLPTD